MFSKKKNMVDRYVDRPDDNRPEELTDNLLEDNGLCSPVKYPKIVPLMSSKKKLHCHKVPFVLRYHVPNKHKYPEQYPHHLLFLFYPFRDESALLSECDGTY